MRNTPQSITKHFHTLLAQINAEQGYILNIASDSTLGFQCKFNADGSPIETEDDLIISVIIDAALKGRQALIIRNAMIDSRFANDWDVMRLQVRSVMCVPLWDEDRIVQLVYVENRSKRGVFNEGQVTLLEELGGEIGSGVKSERRSDLRVISFPQPLQVGGESEASRLEVGKGTEDAQLEYTLKSPNPRYILHGTIGQGGMGIVHRATDRLTGEIIALKQVYFSKERLAHLSQQTSMTERDLRIALAQEFQIVASMRHPHIISVLDYGFGLDQQPYFTMAYLSKSETFLEA
ncbi:MAG: protein kinase family protein, partial [Chloroflexota bacterium]